LTKIKAAHLEPSSPAVSTASFCFLIADIDAPRHDLIKVSAQNPESLAKSLGR
jgi:hypothetical protein